MSDLRNIDRLINEPEWDELEVTITLRNGRLKKLMRSRGFSTMKELHSASGISYQCICHVMNMKGSRPTKEGLANYFGVDVDWLFPPYIEEVIKTNRVVKTMGADAAYAIAQTSAENMSIESGVERVDREDLLNKLMEILSPRQREFMRRRFEGATLESLGQEFSTTRERASQILGMAVHKITRTARGKDILIAAGYMEEEDE